MDLPPSDPVPLSASLRKRLYEPLVVLYCLIAAYREGLKTEPPQPEDAVPKSRMQTFFCFVNKLAHICDVKRGGNTVTAFAVLQTGSVEYRFASNNRKPSDLRKVRAFITDILDTLGSASEDEIKKAMVDKQSEVFSKILQKIVKFNGARVNTYLKSLRKDLEFCIEEAELEDSDAARDAVTGLKSLSSRLDFTPASPKVDDEEFVTQSEAFVRAMNSTYRGTLEDFVRAKCDVDDGGGNIETPWSHIHHSFERLLSYFFAVKILITARKYWPELFVDFVVMAVPSSRPDRDPPAIRKSADGIIPRMTTDHSVLNAYRRNAEDLKAWGLDRLIKEATHHNGFKPIVHAEVLVDDSIRRSEREAETTEDPLRFFREADFGRYIGASKPTCRLCAMYFDAQPDGVKVRSSHLSIYHNWRVPDIFTSDGVKVERQRNAVLEKMVTKLREETFRAIRDKSAVKNRFDSNNTATNPLQTSYITASMVARDGSVETEDVTSRIAMMSVNEVASDSSRDATPTPERIRTPREYITAQVGGDVEGDDDDDEGSA